MKASLILFVSLLVILLCASGTSIVSAQKKESAEAAQISKLSLQFESEVVNLARPIDKLNANYRGYLGKLKSTCQEAGNLKAMLALRGDWV